MAEANYVPPSTQNGLGPSLSSAGDCSTIKMQMNRIRISPLPLHQGRSTALTAIQSAKEQNRRWAEGVDVAAVIGQRVVRLDWDMERVLFQLGSGTTMQVQAGRGDVIVDVQHSQRVRGAVHTDLVPVELECGGKVRVWDRAAVSRRFVGLQIIRLWFADGVLFVYFEGGQIVDFHSFAESDTDRRVLLWSETD